MKKTVLCSFVLMCMLSCSKGLDSNADQNLLSSLQPYVRDVISEFRLVGSERKSILISIADEVSSRINRGQRADLTFICTHNSRRSHMSQIWAQTAACYYNLDDVYSFSGGTEATECDKRTIFALREAGFSVSTPNESENPVFRVTFSSSRPSILAYSKLYRDHGNPEEGFVALLCCSKADMSCPVVEGATARFPIHYVDPQLCNDTPMERDEYRARCREIAREMFFMMSEISARVN